MRIGSAMTDISPKCNINLTGFGNPNRKFEGIHDPIYMTAVVVEQDGEKVLFLSADVLGFDHDKLPAIRKEISAKTGIEPINILFNASHTHSAPEVLGWVNQHLGAYVAEYADWFYEEIVRTAVKADEDLEDGELYFGTIDCYGISVNRRQIVDGHYVGGPNENAVRDDTVTVLKAVCGDKIKSILFNFTCHPSTIGLNFVSGDWPGVARRLVAEKYGCDAGFLQGCCGDIRVRTVNDAGHAWRAGRFDDIERFGKMLADRIDALLSRTMKKVEGKIFTKFSTFDLPLLEKAPKEEYEKRLETDPWFNKGAMEFYVENYDNLPTSRPYSVQRIDLGDKLTFWGLEGEVCMSYNVHIKAMQPDRHAVICGYSNGNPGYIFPKYMYPQGGYEPVNSADVYLLVGGFDPVIEDIILEKCQEIAK